MMFGNFRDTFNNFWGYRDTTVSDCFGDICQFLFRDTIPLFEIFKGIWDTGDPTSRASKLSHLTMPMCYTE